MRSQYAFLVLWLGSSIPLAAQDPPSVASSVETVAIGGYWTSPEVDDGFYRVIIQTGGFEHAVSDIWVQWLARPTDLEFSPRVVATRHLEEIARASVYLMEPEFRVEGEHWILSVTAVQTHCDPPNVERWNVELGLPSELVGLSSQVTRPGCDVPG